MINQFQEILSSMLPECYVIVENNNLAVEIGNKTIYAKVNFGELFELIMNDRINKRIDSGDFYLSALCNVIVGELDKID